jgi:predicted PurR-regulated permease PerM
VSLVPAAARTTFGTVAHQAFLALTAYVRGSALIALIDAGLAAVGLLVLRVPHAPGLACLVFLGAFVPYAGALLSGAVAVLVALADRGGGVAALVVVLFVVVQAVEATVLQPWLQSRAVRMHPAVVLLALTAGAALAGIVGTLIALPLAAVLSATWLSRRQEDIVPAC